MRNIHEIREKYRDDDYFWHFADDFREEVGLSMTPYNEMAFTKLLAECDRRYSYLKENHPAHFRTMCDGFVNRHMSIMRTTVFFVELTNSTDISFDPSGRVAKFNEMDDIANKIAAHLKEFTPSDDVQSTTSELLTSNQVASKIQDFESSVEGRVIATKVFMTPDGRIYMSDDPVLIQITGLHGTESCVQTHLEAEKQGLLSVMEGRVLTGDHRDEVMLVETPIFYSDGSYDANQIETDEREMASTPLPRLLTDSELIRLAEADLLSISGQEITLFEVSAYEGDTNDQNVHNFGAGISAVVDEINSTRMENYYRIDNGNGGSVIDTLVDMSSDHPDASNLRSMWSYGTSYHSDGTVEPCRAFKLPEMAHEYESTRPGL